MRAARQKLAGRHHRSHENLRQGRHRMRVSIIDLLSAAGVETRSIGQHHHASDGWVQVDCPFCGPGSKKFHMGISLTSFVANCWKCGNHRFRNSLLQITGWSVDKLSAELGHVELDQEAGKKEASGILEMPKGIKPMSRLHRAYLKKRGF